MQFFFVDIKGIERYANWVQESVTKIKRSAIIFLNNGTGMWIEHCPAILYIVSWYLFSMVEMTLISSNLSNAMRFYIVISAAITYSFWMFW